MEERTGVRETEKKKESSRTDLGMGVWCEVKGEGKEVEVSVGFWLGKL